MYKHYKNDEEYLKDKQIEEMAEDISKTLFNDCLLTQGGNCEDCDCNRKETKHYDCQSYLVAKKLLEKYQPKIPENAVVLTKKELEDMKFTQKYCDLYKENEWLRKSLSFIRKGTAEKFAPLRKYMWDRFHHYHDIRNKAEADYKKCKDENGKAIINNDYHRADAIMFILGKVLIEFDEICKQIMEGQS